MLSADFLHLEEDVEMVNRYADLFHLDVMDGTFVPNISFGFPVIEAIAQKAKKPMDVHLMIVHPEKYIERFAQVGAQMISFHLEAARADGSDPAAILRAIRGLGVQAGLVINPDVPVEDLYPYLEEVDFLLIMSVFAGFGGQKFIEDTYGRIRTLKAEIDRRLAACARYMKANAAELARCGAEIMVAGSSVFKAEDRAAAIAAMR